jgi:four helix bundle protein
MSSGPRTLEDTEAFSSFVQAANTVWTLARRWDAFAQHTVGEQMVRALDSVGANIAEAGGRHGEADALRFLIIARSSAKEAMYWLERAGDRERIAPDQLKTLVDQVHHGSRALNGIIKYRREHAKGVVKETLGHYTAEPEDDFT